MKCQKCNKKAQIILENLSACKNCFMKIIEKRVRKEIRQSKIKKEDIIVLIDDNSPEAKLSYYFMKKILPYNKIIKKKTQKSLRKGDKIILPVCADDEGEYLLNCAFNNKKPKYLHNYWKGKKHYIKPLLHVEHKEAKILADLLRLKYRDKKYKIIPLLNKLFPDAKFGLVRSALNLSKK